MKHVHHKFLYLEKELRLIALFPLNYGDNRNVLPTHKIKPIICKFSLTVNNFRKIQIFLIETFSSEYAPGLMIIYSIIHGSVRLGFVVKQATDSRTGGLRQANSMLIVTVGVFDYHTMEIQWLDQVETVFSSSMVEIW